MSGKGKADRKIQAIQRNSRQSGKYLDKVSERKRNSNDDSENLNSGDDTDRNRTVRKRCPLDNVVKPLPPSFINSLFLKCYLRKNYSERTIETFNNLFLKCLWYDYSYNPERIFLLMDWSKLLFGGSEGPRKAKTILKKSKEDMCPTRYWRLYIRRLE